MTTGRSLNYWEAGAALIVVALGVFWLWHGMSYPLGSLTRMGPGFFPVSVGIVLIGFGVALVFDVRHSETPPPDVQPRPFIAIFAGLLAFAFLLHQFGLVPATVVLIVLSALGDRPVRPLAIVGTAVVVAAIGYFIFLRGFGLQLEAFHW